MKSIYQIMIVCMKSLPFEEMVGPFTEFVNGTVHEEPFHVYDHTYMDSLKSQRLLEYIWVKWKVGI